MVADTGRGAARIGMLDEPPAPPEVVAWLGLLAGPTPAGLVRAALALPGNPGPEQGPG
ncbi:MAG: hypothetical protein HYX34_13545 [Actinobacteria bacterium]|nr:hypothetical protein [Actinomycetota bacterium]